MGSMRFRNPRALSSILAALGTLQRRALRFLNRVNPLVSVSNLYLEFNVSVLTHLISQLQVYKSHSDLVKEQVSTGRSLL